MTRRLLPSFPDRVASDADFETCLALLEDFDHGRPMPPGVARVAFWPWELEIMRGVAEGRLRRPEALAAWQSRAWTASALALSARRLGLAVVLGDGGGLAVEVWGGAGGGMR